MGKPGNIVPKPCFPNVGKPGNIIKIYCQDILPALCFLAMFPKGEQTRKHCFLAMFPEGGQTRKHCFLAMFPEGGQTREHCFLAMFPKGEQTRKHCLRISNHIYLGNKIYLNLLGKMFSLETSKN
jgi:hypothetical protein